MRRLLSASLLTALALAGCGGDGGGSPYEERGVASGQRTYSVPSEGFSIALPESWRTVSAEEFARGGSLAPAVEETPALAPYAEAIQGPDSVVKFVGVDPAVQDGFATNLNVIVEPLPVPYSLERYTEAFLEQLRAFPSRESEIEHRLVTLEGGRALRASYRIRLQTAGRMRTLATLQYAFVRDRTAYVLTYTTLPELAGSYRDAFERSAASFRSS